MTRLTHLDDEGRARMVDVSGKEPTARLATACAAQISSPVQRRRESSLPVFSLISRVAGEPHTGQRCGNS